MERGSSGANYNSSIFLLPRPLVWQLYLLAWICGSFSAIWPLPSSICFLLLILAAKNLWKLAGLFLSCLLFFSASLLIHFLLSKAEVSSAQIPPWADGMGPYKGRFCGEISQARGLPDRRVRLILEHVRPEADSAAQPLPLLLALVREDTDPFFSPMPGQTVCFKGSIRKVRHNLNSGSDLDRQDWKIRKTLWQAYSNKKSEFFQLSGNTNPIFALREKFRHAFLLALGFEPKERLPEKKWQSSKIQARAILLALCFGDRRLLSYNTSDNFAAATLAHSLALSGQHLGIVGLLALGFVFCVGKWRPPLFLRFPRPRLIFLLSLPLALLYLWLGNAPPSLLRAAGMLFLAAIFIWSERSFTALDLICGALLFFIILNPLSIFDLGLQLSALCVLLIIIFAPFIARISKKIPDIPNSSLNKILRGACQIILISIIIQIFLLPQNLLHFSIAGLCFPLNLLWLPVLGIFVLPLSFLGLFVSLFPVNLALSIAKLLLEWAAFPCQMILELLERMRSWHLLEEHAFLLPHWLFILVFGILAASLAWLLAHPYEKKVRRLSFHFLLLASLLMLVPPALRLKDSFTHKLSVEILDVGQGLSIILNIPNGLRLLFDGGGSAASHFDPGKNIISPLLSHNHSPHVDAVINSHPDMDHMGGLFYILENFKVDSFYHNGHMGRGNSSGRWQALQARENARVLYAGDVILLDGEKDGLRLEVLHPPAPANPEDTLLNSPDEQWLGNHASLVMRLSKAGEGLLLLTGDAEKDTLKHIMKSGRDLKARILVAPHHGSDRSLLRSFYYEVSPELVLAGCAFQNRWNYPGKRLRKFLNELDIPLLDTGSRGRIEIEFADKDRLAVQSADVEGRESWSGRIKRLVGRIMSGNGDKKQ